MARKLSDRFANIRAALELVFESATVPLTAGAIAEHSIMATEGFTASEVSSALSRLLKLDHPPFPLNRILVGVGNNRWAWYNPSVIPQLEDKPRTPPPPPDGATVVKEWSATGSTITQAAPPPPPDFKFDPLPFSREQAQPTVDVPPGVKSITVSVGKVSIRIELDVLADDR
jgi:hypothetical protein